MRIRRSVPAAALAAAAALLAGCGAQVQPAADAATPGYPVTVTNCGVERTFDAPPQRVVVNDINMTEMMFALGLQDHMAGYILSASKVDNTAVSPWKDAFSATPQLGTKINKELVQGAEADLVFAGWNYGFTDSSGVTPQALANVGIASYVLTESCRQGDSSARGIMDPIDALYTDITNLGRIFGVEERARELVDGYKQTIADAQATIPADEPAPRVFLYDGGTDQPLTVGANAAANDVITRAGGVNIFGELDDSWTSVSFAAAADRDPQVILINDYGNTTVDAKEEFLRRHPLMSTTTAVREGNFYALTYPQLTEGPQNPRAIADFAAYLGSLDAS
ncbi:ABC transporter substrate-binding protein [Tomitella gaofuii]|uniref:ABC transporter substrate-binding protein n=1 Tax=Tomitella gaofuii TaxID=2760083 RepID=UPI0015FDE93F|nr:ABC transporter substrate-binding protein [Tomitella gaofuii]